MSQLTNYIEKELGKGFSKDAIKSKLLKVGYTEDQIKQSFATVEGKRDTVVVEPKKSIPRQIAWRKIGMIVGIIGIILLVSVGLLFVNKMFSEGFSLSSASCDDVIGEEKDLCYLEFAKENDDVSVCNSIVSVGLKMFCEQKQWEEDDCSYEGYLGALDRCILDKAIVEKDTTYCYQMPDIDACFKDVASGANDVSFCRMRIGCVSSFALERDDPSLCSSPLIAEFEAVCLRQYALAKNDKSYCPNGEDCLSYATTES